MSRDLLICQLVQIRGLVVKVFVYTFGLSLGRAAPVVPPATVISCILLLLLVIITDLHGGSRLWGDRPLASSSSVVVVPLVLIVGQVQQLVGIEVAVLVLVLVFLVLIVLVVVVFFLFFLLLLRSSWWLGIEGREGASGLLGVKGPERGQLAT